MPDLSEMLGDVYGAQNAQLPPESPKRPPPEWSDDEHLDRAFADWTPGPGAEPPAAERKMFAPGPDQLADDLATALSEAVLAENVPSVTVPDLRGPAAEPFAPPAHESDVVEEAMEAHEADAPVETPIPRASFTELEPEPPAVAPAPTTPAPTAMAWQRDHDDIIPTGRSARGSLPRPSLPRRPAKAAKAQLGPEGPAPKATKAPKTGKPVKADKAEPKAKSSGGLWAKLNQPVGGKKK